MALLGAEGVARADDFAWPAADLALIHSARLWEIRDRGDLAQLALQKLIAARPDSPQAMVELGELDIRIGELAGAAQVLAQLQQRFKDSPAARDFDTEYRLATRDRLQLALVRRLIQMGKGKEAMASLRMLFPGGIPDNSMGAEYYRVLARTPRGWFAAFQGLRRLVAEHPDDPNYQLALARQMLARDGYAVAGVVILYRLAQRDDIRTGDVDQLLAEAFRDLPARRIPTLVLRDYLKRHPDDEVVLQLLVQQRRAIEQQRLLASHGLSRIEPELQRQLIETLEASLTQQDGLVAARARLLMHLLEARADGDALPLDLQFDDPALEAALWWNRGRRELAAQHFDVAAPEMQTALAFHDQDYESAVAGAAQLESVGAVAESGALLSAAGLLAPSSNWLFETRVRWLIDHAQAGAALALLQQRPINRKWSVSSRDELMALALDRRATERLAGGNVENAIEDLQAAIRLIPHDPWMRYRLAGIYQSHERSAQGEQVMSDGVRLAPKDPQMRYAQALYLSGLDDYAGALSAIDAIDPQERSDDITRLHDRMAVALARARARERYQAGDTALARQELLAVEPLAAKELERARELAYSWISIADPEHGIALVQPYLARPGGDSAQVLLSWAQILNSAEDSTRLPAALDQLRAQNLSAADRLEVARIQRALDLREIRAWERDGQYAQAALRLDQLLALDPQNRELRVARAELDLTLGKPREARDRLASLIAEYPDDYDTRLSYVRALTESGNLALARAQLLSIQDHLSADDYELQLSLARRQLGLGDANAALATLRALLARTPARADTLMLAARAERSLRHFALARDYFRQAAGLATGSEALAAKRSSDEIDARLQSSVAGAIQALHQPGVAGVSQLDMATIPTSWIFAHGFEQRFTAHADLVTLNNGTLGDDYNHTALLGTVQAAGPNAPLHFSNGEQTGVALSGGYQTDTLAADLGTTPLGFDVPNVVGGVEWTPTWHSLDMTLGLSRRALTSSVLSYAGLRDPISGEKWGGTVANGPYAAMGLYRERFSLSGSLRFSEITGSRVENNQFLGARAAGSWKFYSDGEVINAYTGLVLNYWDYQHNLSNYTFGSGGYYSPHSYLSTSLPLELSGIKSGWSYQIRASLAYSVSSLAQENFYPNDPALQAAAVRSPFPSGFDSPLFASSHGGSFSISAYAAIERQVTHGLVLGAMLDIDRTDFYHPTMLSFYLRHTFDPFATPLASPPRPTRPYNQ
jgi:predicted Zn-dependent protease